MEDVSLFTQALGSQVVPQDTPTIATEHEEFFLSQGPPSSSSSSISLNISKRPGLSTRTPSEGYNPAWGQSVFVQPKSRAENPPPVSILKYFAEHEKAIRGRISSISDIREESHERALKTAEWSVQPSDQGNVGIRNAIDAASRSGSLKERIWVRSSCSKNIYGIDHPR